MAPKRRGPAPPPPASHQQEAGSDDAEEEPPRARALQRNPQPPRTATATAAHGDASKEDGGPASRRRVTRSSSKTLQLRQVTRSSSKSPALEDEEKSDSSESEAAMPEPVLKKNAAKSKAEEGRKRSAAPVKAPSGKAKKAKTEAGNAKKPGRKLEKAELDPSPSSNSQTGKRRVKADKRGHEEEQANKEATTNAIRSKSRKQGSQREELGEAARGGMTKETTESGGAFTRSKKGKTDKERAGSDLVSVRPKEATTATQNDGAPQSKEGETRDAEIGTDGPPHKSREFAALQNLYSNLAVFVEGIEAQHPCGKLLKVAFEFIDDDEARALESKIKRQRLDEAKAQNRHAVITNDVRNLLIGSMAGQKI